MLLLSHNEVCCNVSVLWVLLTAFSVIYCVYRNIFNQQFLWRLLPEMQAIVKAPPIREWLSYHQTEQTKTNMLQWSSTVCSCIYSLQLCAVVLIVSNCIDSLQLSPVCNCIDSQQLYWQSATVLTVSNCIDSLQLYWQSATVSSLKLPWLRLQSPEFAMGCAV